MNGDSVDQDWWLRLLNLRHADPVSTNDLRAIRAAVDEIERLRSLITAWADAYEEKSPYSDCDCADPYCSSVRELRKAVGL